jgi:hypothetical protein
MPLPRVHAFEWNDREWAPEALRDLIVESLGRTLRWGRVLDGVAEPLAALLRASGATEILDLGSGSGEPAAILAGALRRRGIEPPRIVLTDRFPRSDAWRELQRAEPAIDFVAEPVDATLVPVELSRGRMRTIVNVLHHFPPALADGIVADAVRAGAPTLVVEGFERNPLGFASFAPVGVVALAAGPLLARRQRLAKAVLAWGTPLALAASVWDGLVSTLRVYTEDELRGMVRRAGGDDRRWSFDRYRFPFGGVGTWFGTAGR